MTQSEKQQLLDEQQTIIFNAESGLRQTDYIAAKLAEGKATVEDYADKIAQRQQWRDDINAAEAETARLQAIEPEEELQTEDPAEGEE